LIFQGLNFSRNADIGQIGHFWMGTNLLISILAFTVLTPLTCWSHGVQGVVDHSQGYMITAAYDDGEPMDYAAVEIKAPDSEIAFQSGRTDRNGCFMFQPDRQGRWQVEVKDGMGHRLALDLEVTGDTAAPKETGLQKPGTSTDMSRAAKVITGLSIIFGLFGIFFGWKVRHSIHAKGETSRVETI
jgi:nickel transport protein